MKSLGTQEVTVDATVDGRKIGTVTITVSVFVSRFGRVKVVLGQGKAASA